MAGKLLTMALRLAMEIAPTAIATESTAGKATGMDATTSTKINCKSSKKLSFLNIETAIIKTAIITVKKIKKSPMRITAF